MRKAKVPRRSGHCPTTLEKIGLADRSGAEIAKAYLTEYTEDLVAPLNARGVFIALQRAKIALICG